MSTASHARAAAANPGAEHLFGKFSRKGGWLDVAMRVVHGTWKAKKAPNLAACMGVGTRAAEHVLSGRNAPSSDALVNLLRSPEIGPALLDALFGDLDWYQQRQNLLRIVESERERAELWRRQAELEAKTKTRRRR